MTDNVCDDNQSALFSSFCSNEECFFFGGEQAGGNKISVAGKHGELLFCSFYHFGFALGWRVEGIIIKARRENQTEIFYCFSRDPGANVVVSCYGGKIWFVCC